MVEFIVDMTKIKENKSFYLIGLCASITYAAGIFALSVYNRFGGLALGLVIAFIAFFAEVYFIATAGAVAKVRTKGTLIVSSVLLLYYVGLFISCDIARNTPAIGEEMGLLYGDIGMTDGLVVAVLVFEVICLALLLLTIAKYVANAFGKELAFYERILGTAKARQEHKEDSIEELPKKDTDRIVLEAKADVSSIKINDVNPVYPPEKEAESVIPEHKIEVHHEEVIEEESEGVEESPIEVNEPIIAGGTQINLSESEESPLDAVVEEDVEDNEEELFSSSIIDEEPTAQTFARDVRQEYVIHRTTHKDDEEDDLYTDFSYGADDSDN